MIPKSVQKALEARFYPDLQEVVFARFDAQLSACLGHGAIVLDAGAGPGSWILEEHRGRIRLWVGEDVYRSEEALWDALVLAPSDRLPFADDSFDVVVCYNVIEHLPDPAACFAAYARVLKPGGYLCFKTPAARTPLFLLAKLLPTAFHRRLKSAIGTDEEDVFPTVYRANDLKTLEVALTSAGFRRHWRQRVDQTYAYCTHARWTFCLGLLYSRLTQRRALAWLRNQIIGIYRMPKESA